MKENTSRFHPRLEVLSEAQKSLWFNLQPCLKDGFVLYGGTAIALRLAHRPSVDFDFFNDKALDKSALKDSIPLLEQAEVLQDSPNTWTLLIQQKEGYVKISFFGGLTFGRIGEPELTIDNVLQVASLDDLMVMKLKVILQRIEAKDYRDIAKMIKAGISIKKGLAGARAMFGPNFQPSECLKALVYFEGGDLNSLTQDEKDTLINAAKAVRKLPQISIISKKLSIEQT